MVMAAVLTSQGAVTRSTLLRFIHRLHFTRRSTPALRFTRLRSILRFTPVHRFIQIRSARVLRSIRLLEALGDLALVRGTRGAQHLIQTSMPSRPPTPVRV